MDWLERCKPKYQNKTGLNVNFKVIVHGVRGPQVNGPEAKPK
jgi:hypothetical protein